MDLCPPVSGSASRVLSLHQPPEDRPRDKNTGRSRRQLPNEHHRTGDSSQGRVASGCTLRPTVTTVLEALRGRQSHSPGEQGGDPEPWALWGGSHLEDLPAGFHELHTPTPGPPATSQAGAPLPRLREAWPHGPQLHLAAQTLATACCRGNAGNWTVQSCDPQHSAPGHASRSWPSPGSMFPKRAAWTWGSQCGGLIGSSKSHPASPRSTQRLSKPPSNQIPGSSST